MKQNCKNKKPFWPYAKCTHSLKRFDPGCKKYREKFDVIFGLKNLVRVRRYVGPDGEIRRTVEIEI